MRITSFENHKVQNNQGSSVLVSKPLLHPLPIFSKNYNKTINFMVPFFNSSAKPVLEYLLLSISFLKNFCIILASKVSWNITIFWFLEKLSMNYHYLLVTLS